jgi:MoaA/NifB/PqqE/SkfB family radical SAM enzyme
MEGSKNIKSLFAKRKPVLLCYAPLNNMLIDQQGNVRICCHNSNDFTLGRYPEQSLNEIWFGDKRRDMVDEFIAGKIPASCYNCITNGINLQSPDSKIFSSKTNLKTGFNDYPKQIEFLLGNECNLSCIMCATNKSSKISVAGYIEEAIPYGDDFLNQISPFLKKVNFTVFSGGEPFLIPIYKKIWELLASNNPKAGIYVQTNGTILNEEIKNLLKKYKIQLGVSIDSLKQATYEKIRVGGNFQTTYKNLQYFQEYSKSNGNHMTLMATPMIANAMEVPELLGYCNTNELLLSLSILNWPYQHAIWSLPSGEISRILEHYRLSGEKEHTQTEMSSRNNLVFDHFFHLVESYYETKKRCEKQKEEYHEKLAATAISFKEYIFKTDQAVFLEKLKSFANKLSAEYNDRIVNEDFAYLIFKGKDITYFYDLFLRKDEEKLYQMGKNRLEELIFLAESNSFDRFNFDNF